MKNKGNHGNNGSNSVHGHNLKAKPKCPWCELPIGFVYDDAVEGHIGIKCSNCNRPSVLDLKTMIAIKGK